MMMIKKHINNEVIRYLFVGGCTTALSWGIFALAIYLGMGTIMANTVANVIAILFAFFANKMIVFRADGWEMHVLLPEMGKFFASRVFTHVLETVALFALVDGFGWHPVLMKTLTMVVIQVCGNYVLSKRVVFVKK